MNQNEYHGELLDVQQTAVVERVQAALGWPAFTRHPTTETAHFQLQGLYAYCMDMVKRYNGIKDAQRAMQWLAEARRVKIALEAGSN